MPWPLPVDALAPARGRAARARARESAPRRARPRAVLHRPRRERPRRCECPRACRAIHRPMSPALRPPTAPRARTPPTARAGSPRRLRSRAESSRDERAQEEVLRRQVLERVKLRGELVHVDTEDIERGLAKHQVAGRPRVRTGEVACEEPFSRPGTEPALGGDRRTHLVV